MHAHHSNTPTPFLHPCCLHPHAWAMPWLVASTCLLYFMRTWSHSLTPPPPLTCMPVSYLPALAYPTHKHIHTSYEKQCPPPRLACAKYESVISTNTHSSSPTHSRPHHTCA
eukprot:1159145-Pelagomonas_calceolata.AAC.8